MAPWRGICVVSNEKNFEQGTVKPACALGPFLNRRQAQAGEERLLRRDPIAGAQR